MKVRVSERLNSTENSDIFLKKNKLTVQPLRHKGTKQRRIYSWEKGISSSATKAQRHETRI
jgi:hypothetical protein